MESLQDSLIRKFPKVYQITATIRAPQYADVEQVKRVVRQACLVLKITDVKEITE